VVRTVATENRGIDELAAAIEQFRKHFESSGQRRQKHIDHWKNRLIEMLESRLLERVLGGKDGEALLMDLAAAVAERKKDPFSAVGELLKIGGFDD
jgi:LAO/AO transport system kinase